MPRDWSMENVVICSIDPGVVNFAIRIEERGYDLTIEPPILKYCNTILYHYMSLKSKDGKHPYRVLTEFFNTIQDELSSCHIFLIELQLAPLNIDCIRIEQHVLSYITIKFPDSVLNPMIFIIDGSIKYRQFGVKGLNEHDRKLRSVDIAEDLLKTRGDIWSCDKMINNRKNEGKGDYKRDDLADVVIQIEAFLKLLGYSDYNPPNKCTLSGNELKLLNDYMMGKFESHN